MILAIALIDLPFNIDDRDNAQIREGTGGSWSFLACECDDTYSDIVQEIILICSFPQIRALCFFEAVRGQGNVLSRATPKCRETLTHALRFLGRFEFVNEIPSLSDPTVGLKTFDALDFNDSFGHEDGRRIVLQCYSSYESFKIAVSSLLWETRTISPCFLTGSIPLPLGRTP